MNRNQIIMLTLAVCAVAALAGCASTNYAKLHAKKGLYTGSPNRSEALNVAVATGLTECHNGQCAPLSDVSRSKLPASLQNKSNVEIAGALMDSMTIGAGIGQMVGVASVISGLGNIAGGLMTIGSVLLGPNEMPDPATKPTIIAWMPKSMAKNPEKARKRLMTIIYESLDIGSFHGYRVSKEAQGETLIKFRFHGKKMCGAGYDCLGFIRLFREPMVARQPSWLGAKPAFVWANWSRGQMSDDTMHTIELSYAIYDLDEDKSVLLENKPFFRRYITKMSANLPRWVYIYLPPDETHNYPVMLNEGEVLLFIEPKQQVAGLKSP